MTETKNGAAAPAIKLIVSDVDGTLVDSGKKISPANVEAILAAQEAGCEVAIASGRAWNEVIQVRQVLPSIRYYICSNGALIMDAWEGKPVFRDIIDNPASIGLLQRMAAYDVFLEAYAGDHIFVDAAYLPRIDEFVNSHIKPLVLASRTFIPHMIDFLAKEERTLEKAQLFYGTTEKRDRILADCGGDKDFTLIISSESNLEFSKPGVSKGKALENLAERLGLGAEEIMTIGDSNNDIPMLRYAGTSFAMANGEETAKAAARFLADSNDQDGVGKAIRQVLSL